MSIEIKKKHTKRNILIAIMSAFLFCFGVILIWTATLKIPDIESFNQRKIIESTKIYDRTGDILLYDIHKNIKRTVVRNEDISRNIKNATVAIEDDTFYEHNGIRPLSFLRAVLANIITGSFGQGGSTITQQVVKNSILTPEKKISRKIKEWVFAVKLEKIMSKEEILALYLNEAPYGGNIYGIEEASEAFFDKTASEINLAEAAYLAALPQAPTYYSPYGNNTEKLKERKNLVLYRMKVLNFITEDEYNEALGIEVEFIAQEDSNIKAPHFVFYIRSYLEEKYGSDVVLNGGLKVITTLDYEIQKKAEKIIKKYALENQEKFNAENAGLVAIDPKTGHILAMVGSRDYFDEKIDGNFNITIAHRQPGSAFKPFVYATAFKKGYTPETVVFDLQTQFETSCDALGVPLYEETSPDICYMPVNYDGKYHGPISLRDALAQSVNIPAIKTLYLAGLNESLQTAKDFGIRSLTNISQYGLTLVLGGGEVSLLDITSAYGVFANNGVKNDHTGIIKVEDKKGNIFEEFNEKNERVIEKNIAQQISDILSDNEARAPAFGDRSYLYFDKFDVAVKTGTTNDYRDAWIIGYTPSIVVGTWAGNNDNSPMEKKVAGFIVAPMWNAFMQDVLKERPVEYFTDPTKIKDDIKPILRGYWQGGEQYFIDSISGKLTTEYTPKETIKEMIVTNIHNILYWVDKKDPLGEKPKNPELDPQFNLWEYPVREWVKQNNIKEEMNNIIPTEYDDVHKPEYLPLITVLNPSDNSIYQKNEKILVLINYSGKYPISRIDAFINNEFIGSVKKTPFQLSFIPGNINNIQSKNILRVIIYDSVLNKKEENISFYVN